MIIGLLGYTTAILRASADDTDAVIELYAAEAGIIEVKNLLLEAGSITTPSVLPALEVGGMPVEVSITPPIKTAPDTPQYIDPLVLVVSGNENHVFTIESVRAGTALHVNWAYSPDPSTSTINIYRGPSADGGILTDSAVFTMSPGSLRIDPTVVDAYTIEFENNGTTTVQSAGFGTAGDTNTTWVYVSSYKDYVVTSRAGNTTITAYLRQIPGPTDPPVPQQVYTLSWKPHE